MTSLITIDGPAGSGKTTLAGLIEESLTRSGDDVLTIHLDDLYNGWDDALGTSLTAILKRILHEFEDGDQLTVPLFDWSQNRYTDSRVLPRPSILILEGVGSGQRITRSRADIKLWVEAPPELALSRVLERDGEVIRTQMELWQVREREHFALEESASAADYRVKSAP